MTANMEDSKCKCSYESISVGLVSIQWRILLLVHIISLLLPFKIQYSINGRL